MKKSLLTFSAACLAMSAMAVAPQHLQDVSVLNLDRSTPLQSNIEGLSVRPASPEMMKAPRKEASSTDVITEVEGTVQNMTTTGSGYYVYWYWIMEYQNQAVANHVVYGDNNEVYFYNLLPNAPTDSYVKGVKNGDKVEVSLSQVLLYYDAYDYGFQLNVLDYAEEEDPETGEPTWTYYLNEGVESVTFTVDPDGGMVLSSLEENQILGFVYTDDLTWAGYGASELSMVPFNEIPVTVPDDFEVSKAFWMYNAGDYGWSVNWAQGYDEVYFQGLSSNMPDAWFKGEVAYDDYSATISIPQDQYLGVAYGQYIYTKCAKLYYDEDGNLADAELMPEDYRYELIWDLEENTLTAKDPEVAFLYNAAKDRIYYLQYFEDIKLVHQDDFEGTPVNPYNLRFVNTMETYGYDAFYFTVPAVSTEGDLLDTTSLYYVVYVDDEPWTFEPEEYGTDEAIEEIPWNTSLYYIYNYGGAEREVDFFVEGISTVGVQSVYCYNGEVTRSEIVTLTLDDVTAVKTVDSDKEGAKVMYFDLAGRAVANPTNGLYIKRTTYTDGTTVSAKKFVR